MAEGLLRLHRRLPGPLVAVGFACLALLWASLGPTSAAALPPPIGPVTISGLPGAFGVGVDLSSDRVFVSDSAINNPTPGISVVDGKTNVILSTIGAPSLNSNPIAVAVDQVTNEVYVTDPADSGVLMFSATNPPAKVTQACTGSLVNPYGIAVDDVTNTLYVGGNSSVSVLSGTNCSQAATPIAVPCASNVAVDPAADLVFAPSSCNNEVYVINGSTNQIASIEPLSCKNPENVAVDPPRGLVYVSCTGNANALGEVAVLSEKTDAQLRSLGTDTPWGIAVNGAGAVFVASQANNYLRVFDGPTDVVGFPLPTGGSPQFVAANPLTGFVYVAALDGTVTVYNATAMAPAPT